MIRTFRLLDLRRARARPLHVCLAIAGVSAGIALATSVLVMTGSTKTSLRHLGEALSGGAPLRVVGTVTRGSITPALVDRIAAAAGVEHAVPAVQAVTLIERPDHTTIRVLAEGVDCSFIGCPAPAPVLIGGALLETAGPGARIRSDDGAVSLTTATTAPALDRINGGRIVVFPLATAQRLFARPSGVDVVYVYLRPGASSATVSEAVGSAGSVLHASAPPPAFNTLYRSLAPILGFISLIGLAVGAALIGNSMTLTLEERRRDLAIAKAVGASPALLLACIVVEGASMGTIGGVLGGIGGVGLAHPLIATLSDYSSRTAGARLTVHFTATALVSAILLGAATAALTTWFVARRVIRAPEMDELSPAIGSSGRAPTPALRLAAGATIVGAVGVGLALAANRNGATARWQPAAAGLGVALAATALLVAAAALAPWVAVRAGRVIGWRSPHVRASLASLAREPRRCAVMALAVAAAVGEALAIASFSHSLRTEVVQAFQQDAAGRVSVSNLDQVNSLNMEANLSPLAVAQLASLPGVRDLARESTLVVGQARKQPIWVVADEHPALGFRFVAGPRDATVLDRGDVFVGPTLARQQHLRVGSRLSLLTPQGPVSVTVGAVWEDPRFLGSSVFMSYGRMTTLFGPQPPNHVYLDAAPGTSTSQLLDEVRRSGIDPDVIAASPHGAASAIADQVVAFSSPFWALQRVMLLVTFIAIFSAMSLVGLQRRREHAVLLTVAVSRGGLARLIIGEAVAVAVIGGVLGALQGFGVLVAFTGSSLALLGIPAQPHPVWAAPALYGVLAGVIAIGASALPAFRAGRVELVSALRYE